MGIFGGANASIHAPLRNPNELREAFVYQTVSGLPKSKINEFVKSEEARVMVQEGYMSYDVLERLAQENEMDKYLQSTVCQLAKDAEDPLWQELINKRAEERQIFNQLVEEYGKEAKSVAEAAKIQYIDKGLPSTFK